MYKNKGPQESPFSLLLGRHGSLPQRASSSFRIALIVEGQSTRRSIIYILHYMGCKK